MPAPYRLGLISTRFFMPINTRSYFAAVISKQPIRARLVEKSNASISLETFEPHAQQRKLREEFQAASGLHNQLLEYIRKRFKLNSWGERFSISPKGIIICNPASPLWSESFSDRIDIEPWYRHDLLFSIPQEVWDGFIAQLPYPKVVQLLNLSTHRHLWRAFNYAATAPNDEIRKNRATSFGEYHFLLSFLPIHSDNKPCNRYNNNDEILKQIDQGKSPIHIFQNKEPYLTRSFINKCAYLPDWQDVKGIGRQLILPKAKKLDGQIDMLKLKEFIAALPSSKQDPQLFFKWYEDYRYITNANPIISEKATSNIFYHFRKNPGFFKEKKPNTQLFKDYIAAIARDLIFPEYIRQIKTMHSLDLIKMDLPQYLNNNRIMYMICNDLISLLAGLVTEKVLPERLVTLEQKWHRNIAIISDKKPIEPGFRQWHALFDKQIIDDVTFICLTNNRALKEEGKVMDHCVGGYDVGCLEGACHIVSAQTSLGDRSTLELIVTKKENGEERVTIKQNVSADREGLPAFQIKKASDKFVSKINSKKILLNPERGKKVLPGTVESDENTMAAHEIYPYHFEDEVIQEQIYQVYLAAKVLPSFMKAATYAQMMQKSGLGDAIIDKLKGDWRYSEAMTMGPRPF